MNPDTERKKRWREKIKAEQPDSFDPCGNPKCKYKIPRWNRLKSSFIPIYCGIECANKCRTKNKGHGPITVESPRTSNCHRQGLPTEPKGVMCADYLECLDTVATGGKWKCKGELWREPPNSSTVGKSLGGSFAPCRVTFAV